MFRFCPLMWEIWTFRYFGPATESFVDNVDRMNFINWAEHEALGDTAPIIEMEYPRAKSHRQVPMAVRRMLAVTVAA